MIASGLTVGMGHSGLQRFCEGTGMNGLHNSSYLDHVDDIFDKSKDVSHVILTLSRQKVVEYYRQYQPSQFDDHGILSLAVSYDGSWPKRGHTSKLGFGAVIDVHTGLVVDFQILSLHCQLCESTGARLKKNGGYDAWYQHHVENGRCLQNYQGSSGGMEPAAAVMLWQRSLDHKMSYTMVGDGDTNTYLKLKELKPYGDEHPVKKEECVNHVSKRLNTGLRNLKSTLNKKSIRIGGNAKGSLTDSKIGTLQSYYTGAVRGNNSSVEAMSEAIWRPFYHSSSQHQHCPSGLESWCWYQNDLAMGFSLQLLAPGNKLPF